MSELSHREHDLNRRRSDGGLAGVGEKVQPAASDLFLPAHVIVRLALEDRAWHDGISWRVSVERRLWPLWRQPPRGERAGSFPAGTRVSFHIPCWPEKHPATDHTSTTERAVRGWVAGEDADGLLVVDASGTVWAGLYEVEISVEGVPRD